MKTKLLLLFLFLNISIQAQTNLVPNGDFENWTSSSQPDKWFRSFSGLVFQSTSAQNGSSSTKMQITSGTLNFINSEFFPVVAGKTYRITMYHKLVTGTFSAIDLSLYHQPGTFKTEIAKKTDAVTSSTEWRKIEFDYTPTVSESIEVDIWTTGTLNSEILVDNVSVVDAATLGPLYTVIPDLNFEKKLIALGHDSGTPDGKVLTSTIASVTSLNLDTQYIADLTGIQDFISLKTLICIPSNGNYSISGGSGLLTKLDVTKNTALTSLSCYANKIKDIDLSKNVLLTSLEVYGNGMTALNVSNNVALTTLDCGPNKISSLDVSKNVGLKYLDCENNQLTTIDISKNVALINLDCDSNQLTTIDISKNVALEYLSCSSNKLTTLDLSKNVALVNLDFRINQLTTLDLSKNVALVNLICTNNQLTTLELSKNTALKYLDCSSNQLTSLNLKNGKNTLIISSILNLTRNPNLSCILVDDATYANTNWGGKKDTFAYFSPYDCSLTTQILDGKFEDKLIALGIDTDGKNGVVLNSSIATITTLDVSNSGIIDLKGIEGFKALITLNCSGNQLKKLDLSKNTAIATLNCSNNPSLTCIQVADIVAAEKWNTTKDTAATFSLDCTKYTLIPDAKFEDKLITLGIDRDGKNGKVVTESIASITSLDVNSSSITDLTGIQDFVSLKTLYCNVNGLTNLDITKNVVLQELSCNSNQLTALDLSKNVDLRKLFCSSNKLTTLDISKNVALTRLDSYDNKLTTLDTSKNIALIELYCYSNQLTALDLVNNTALLNLTFNSNQLTTLDLSKNVALRNLSCSSNKLTTLDLSKNVALVSLSCSSNQLTSLNLKNGKNSLILTTSINLLGNPNLKCILVDDEVYANTNWSTKKDATASFNATDCTTYTLIPDEKFEDKLILLGIDTDGKNGKVKTASIELITDLSIINAGIKDLTGIQDFKSLKSLVCNANELTTIDLSKNVALTELYCNNNLITTLDVSKNINLSYLACFDNQIAVLDVSKNVLLKTLSARNNKITSLDLSKNVLLETLICKDNVLTTLNLKNGKNMILSMLDTRNNSALFCVLVDDVAYAVANFTQKDATTDYSLNCSATIVYTTIPDEKFEEKLIVLGIDNDGKNGKVKTTSIEYLKAINLQMAEIKDLTGIQDFKNLEVLDCGINSLTQLDVTKNLKLTELYCHFNYLTSLDVSKNILLTIIQANKNSLQKFDVSTNKVLADLNVKDNLLTTLNLKNGYNTKALYYLTKGNPNLSCIQVDSKTYADTNWSSSKDVTASYSESCANLSTSDVVFEKLSVFPNPTKGSLFIENVTVNKVVVYDTLGKLIKVPFSSNGTSTTANLEQFPKGIYYMYIESEGETTVRKVIVE